MNNKSFFYLPYIFILFIEFTLVIAIQILASNLNPIAWEVTLEYVDYLYPKMLICQIPMSKRVVIGHLRIFILALNHFEQVGTATY